MDITPIIDVNKKVINGYGPGKFTINNDIYYGSQIVYVDEVISIANFNINDITEFDTFKENDNLEVVLVGTGEKHIFPILEVKKILDSYRVNFEFMSTGSACRTYNVLVHEDRNVCAILISL